MRLFDGGVSTLQRSDGIAEKLRCRLPHLPLHDVLLLTDGADG